MEAFSCSNWHSEGQSWLAIEAAKVTLLAVEIGYISMTTMAHGLPWQPWHQVHSISNIVKTFKGNQLWQSYAKKTGTFQCYMNNDGLHCEGFPLYLAWLYYDLTMSYGGHTLLFEFNHNDRIGKQSNSYHFPSDQYRSDSHKLSRSARVENDCSASIHSIERLWLWIQS